MEIDMTKFIDDYLAREGITREVREELNYRLNNEVTSLDQLNEIDFKRIKVMCGSDMLTNSEMRGLILMMCNDELGINEHKEEQEWLAENVWDGKE